MMHLALLFLGAYVLGAIPVGVLVARAHGVDLFKFGSGNVGATNVARAVGRPWGIAVFILDALKGFSPALIAHWISPHVEVWFAAGLAAVIGHCASPFLRFKGGKGVSTALGMVAGSLPLVAAGGFLVWCIVFALTRYVSLSSIIGTFVGLVLCATLPGRSWYVLGAFTLLFLFVVYTHRANIRRLREGTEPKFEFRNQPQHE